MIGVSTLQSFIASMTQKLTLSYISDESKNYPDKARIFSASFPPNSKFSTLSLHDALPISFSRVAISCATRGPASCRASSPNCTASWRRARMRSEEHTSELQSRFELVCRLLLEKKNR